MSSVAHDAGWLGDREDWGLSAAKLGELGAELDDHLHCLQADEGLPATEQVRESLKRPASRRKLAGPHLTDQVYATLSRWPTRREWRELLFLLACFALILLSDWLANWVTQCFNRLSLPLANEALPQVGNATSLVAIGAWLLQGAARGAFFAGFLYMLWRAWRLGWGVLLARILQLKLIHTVLVVSALLVLGNMLWLSWFSGYGYALNLSLWLNASAVLIGMVLIGTVLILVKQRRYWPIGLFAILTGIFLYSGGPLVAHEFTVARPIARETREMPDGSSIYVPSNDAAAIAKSAQTLKSAFPDCELDIPHNKVTFHQWCFDPMFGVWTERGSAYAGGNTWRTKSVTNVKSTGGRALVGPVVAAGGGLGWLAVPIPFLGLIGLTGLVLIMGRRGPAEFVAYSAICVFAILATILPFVYGRAPNELFEFSALGMLLSPLPAFEELLTYYELDWGWVSLVGGLVFSASVPWLLAGLFLRPERGTLPPVDEQVAE